MPSSRHARSSSVLALVLVGCGGSAPPPSPPESSASASETTAEARRADSRPKASAAPHEPKPVERDPDSIVGLAFEPLVMGVRPGGKLLLAAHFRIAPGYRISWKAPGEVGQPTNVTFRAPPGFEVGEVLFPAPIRFTLPGGYTGFGYENETAVFVEVRAPASLRRDDVSRFDLDASWVACRRICATERTAAFVELATTYGDARERDVEASVAPFRARLPKPLESLHEAETRWDAAGPNAVFVVKVPGATPKDFFPDGTADPKPKKTEMADGELRFVFDDAPKPGSRPLRGVLVATLDQKEAYFDVEAKLPGAEEKSPKAEKPAKEPAPKKRRR